MPTGLRTALWGLAAVLSGAWRSRRPESIWPPDDYYVEVRYQGGPRGHQRVRFWQDGLVFYGEASDSVGGPEEGTVAFPVFAEISAYEMRPESIRHLSRLLERAGLNDLSGELVDAGDGTSPMVTIHWRAFEQRGDAWVAGRVQGSAVRVLQVVNAFLPPGRAFDCDGLSVGDPEPAHLVEVPLPVVSVKDALAFYRDELLPVRAPTEDLAIEAFALALEAEDFAGAEELLKQIEASTGDPSTEWWVLPGGDRAGLVLQLRLLLERRQRAREQRAKG